MSIWKKLFGSHRASFLEATSKGDLDAAKSLLKRSPKLVFSKDSKGETPLHLAARGGHLFIVKLLLDNNAEVNAENDKGLTPLCEAEDNSPPWGSKEDLIELLVQRGGRDIERAIAEVRDEARDGNLEKVEAMLKVKPDLVLSKDRKGRTPLHYAASEGYKTVAELIIANNADVNAKDQFGSTPLHCAYKHKEVVELLLAKGAKVNAKTASSKTPLHDASTVGHIDVVEFLLNKGAEINAKDNAGQTPLHKAAHIGRKDVVESLLAKGAEVDVKDNDGMTPLHWSATRGNKEVMGLLLAYKADPHAKANTGHTPVHLDRHGDIEELLRR